MRARALPALLVAAACDYRAVDAVLAPGRPGAGAACEVPHVTPEQQTLLGAGERSHWLQPWHAWSDTFPARRMREAVGVTLSSSEKDDPANNRLLALQSAGIARVYTAFNWSGVEYDAPSRMRADVRAETLDWLMALKARKLRPHVMVQGHYGDPCPSRSFSMRLTAAAPAGATKIKIDPAALPQIVPGRTGLSASGRMAGVLFTGFSADGTVTLSRPLPEMRAAGTHTANTLRFPPFQRPRRADGSPNPVFEEAMRGWEQFLTAVAAEMKPIFGDAWDLELWNEINHSEFLDANNYYEPDVDDGPGPPYDAVARRLLERSEALIRSMPGLAGVRVVSGISNSRFQDAASTLPPGVALSRHLALHGASYPASAADETTRAVRADGQPNGAPGGDGRWREAFTPTYVAAFPEQALAALRPPKLIFPDLSPHATIDGNGNARGRNVRPEGGPPPPVVVSSFNLSPDRRWFTVGAGGNAAELTRFKIKSALRAIAAHVGRGVESFIFYQGNEVIDLVDVKDPTGGPVVRAVGRFMAQFRGPDQIARPRTITLESAASCTAGKQLEGNGTPEFPPLWDSEVVAFFPFQLDDNRFVAPAYVMTRDLGKVHRPAAPATDVTRRDEPPETFTLVLRGPAPGARMEWFDPLTTEGGALTPTALGDGRVQVDVPLTDSVRLITITDG